MANGDFVSYLRVSKAKQGTRGLRLEAQREAVATYLNVGKWKLVEEVLEVESGIRNDRPSLDYAVRLCRKHRATLIFAKLDRLARNAHFISGLMESCVDFVVVDMPEANRRAVHILAAVAEQEAVAISKRTKAVLVAVKATGKHLDGGCRDSSEPFAEITEAARMANAQKAAKARAEVLSKIKKLQASGATSLRQIAAGLNALEIPTPRDVGSWSAAQVQRVLGAATSRKATS
jgi:DNA invertase Pin-like site-specific DNA recombinase